MLIQAIETQYKGYSFRSRLEARWAVFFDALGIDWFYEHQGYILPDGEMYLPDFYLPQINIIAEVKPILPDHEHKIWGILRQIDEDIGFPLILDGPPEAKAYWSGRSILVYLVSEYLPPHKDSRCFYGPGGLTRYDDADWFYGYPYPFSSIEGRGEYAVRMARSARFEHGEEPIVTPYTKLHEDRYER